MKSITVSKTVNVDVDVDVDIDPSDFDDDDIEAICKDRGIGELLDVGFIESLYNAFRQERTDEVNELLRELFYKKLGRIA